MKKLLLTLVLFSTLGTANLVSAGENDSTAEAHVDRGLFFSLGSVGTHLELGNAAKASLAEAGIQMGTNGTGGEALIGYRFGKHISLGLRFTGVGLDTGRPGIDGGLGLVTLEVAAYLRPGEKVQPYLVGGTSGAALFFEGDDLSEDTSLEGHGLNVGTGVDVHFSDHWTLSFDYRATLLDFEESTIDFKREPDVMFEGDGIAHLVGFRWSYRL